MKKTKRPWRDSEVAQLIELREVKKLKWKEIDYLLKRSTGGSRIKHYELRHRTRRPAETQIGHRISLSADIEAARRARKDAENRMSPAAALLGDPPPGFSALDRKRQQVAP